MIHSFSGRGKAVAVFDFLNMMATTEPFEDEYVTHYLEPVYEFEPQEHSVRLRDAMPSRYWSELYIKAHIN